MASGISLFCQQLLVDTRIHDMAQISQQCPHITESLLCNSEIGEWCTDVSFDIGVDSSR